MELVKNTKVRFDEFTHTYECDGKLLKGVTTLLSDYGLSEDYSFISKEVLDKAAEVGTAIHKKIEKFDNGEAVEVDKMIKNYDKLGLNVIASEYLVSDNISIASSIDKVAATENDNEVDLIDLKTTYKLYRESVTWQLSIYKYLFELQNPGIKVRSIYALHYNKDKCTFRLKECTARSEEDVVKLIESNKKGEPIAFPSETKQLNGIPSEQMVKIENTFDSFLELTKQIDVLGDTVDYFKNMLLEHMIANGIYEARIGKIKLKVKEPRLSRRFDTTKFKQDRPEDYEEYVVENMIKGSLIITKL